MFTHKGGGNEAFTAMHKDYENFKDWFQSIADAEAQGAMDRATRKSQSKQRGEDAMEGGRKALVEHRNGDAVVFATQAIREFEAYKLMQTRKLAATVDETMLEAQELHKVAVRRIALNEEEKRRKQEHDEMCKGLTALLHTVSNTKYAGLTSVQMVEELRLAFNASQVSPRNSYIANVPPTTPESPCSHVNPLESFPFFRGAQVARHPLNLQVDVPPQPESLVRCWYIYAENMSTLLTLLATLTIFSGKHWLMCRSRFKLSRTTNSQRSSTSCKYKARTKISNCS